MYRPNRGYGGSAPAPDPSTLRRLLQSGPNASIVGQRLSDPSPSSDDRGDFVIARPRRSSSRLRADELIGTHTVRTDDYRRVLAILASARKRSGLTQQQLAKRIRKPQSFVLES